MTVHPPLILLLTWKKMNAVWNSEHKYWILSTPTQTHHWILSTPNPNSAQQPDSQDSTRYVWPMTWAEGLYFLLQGKSSIENNILLTRNPIPELKDSSVRAFSLTMIE
jgi:hypothetical protein